MPLEKRTIELPRFKTVRYGKHSLSYEIWNHLPNNLRNVEHFGVLNKLFKRHGQGANAPSAVILSDYAVLLSDSSLLIKLM